MGVLVMDEKNPVRDALDGFDYQQYFAEHDGLALVDYGEPVGHEML